MNQLSRCPVCEGKELKVLYVHKFVADEEIVLKDNLANVSALQERLWIYFHKIKGDLTPSSIESTLCSDCGFIFTNPRLSEEDITTKYQTIAELGLDQKKHKKAQIPGIKPRSKRIYNLIKKKYPFQPPKSALDILDYGGAEGYLLKPFVEEGHNGFLLDYIKYNLADTGIQYLGKDLSDLKPEHKFDVILLLHTLEHVANPIKLVQDLKKRLKPGGILYVEVPLGAWTEWRFLIDPITHVNFFSEQSLFYILEKAGLNTIFLNSQWQWVTNDQHLCINIIGENKEGNTDISPTPTKKQINQLKFYPKALQINFRYYLKLFLKSLFN